MRYYYEIIAKKFKTYNEPEIEDWFSPIIARLIPNRETCLYDYDVVLAPEVMSWCKENLKQTIHATCIVVVNKTSPARTRIYYSCRLSFENNTDLTFFKMRWS